MYYEKCLIHNISTALDPPLKCFAKREYMYLVYN